jgi:hypothetical protein
LTRAVSVGKGSEMIPGGRRDLLIALVSLVLAPASVGAQPDAVPAAPQQPPAAAQQPAPAEAQQPGVPAPAPPATVPSAAGVQTPQPPPQQQGAEEGAKVLGRPRPAMVTPPPRAEEPDVSVSVVSPQKPSVFGRRTRRGGEPRGMSADERGQTEGFGGTMGAEEPEAPSE